MMINDRFQNQSLEGVKMLFVQLFTETEKGQRSFGAQLRIFNDICFNKGFLSPRTTQVLPLLYRQNILHKRTDFASSKVGDTLNKVTN